MNHAAKAKKTATGVARTDQEDLAARPGDAITREAAA
jgi:hypothetical protein